MLHGTIIREIIFYFYLALINAAGETAIATNTSSNSKNEYVHSILQCHVALDRLEQSTINQLIQNSLDNNDNGNIEPTVYFRFVDEYLNEFILMTFL